MSDAAERPILGRCPTCGRLVTLPAAAQSSEVACPVCKHRARGTAFTAEAPLPVVLVDPRQPSTAAPAQKNGFEPVTRARLESGLHEERTHLLLDVPMDDEEAPAAPRKAPARARSNSEDAAGEARTHLLLSPSDLEDEDPEPPRSTGQHPAPAGRRQGRPRAASTPDDEGRTRLLVGPLSLRTEGTAPGAAALGRLIPAVLRASVWLEEALHGRETWVLVAFAVGLGGVAPSLDYVWSGGRSTLGVFIWALSLIGFSALALARVNGLRGDEGTWDPTLAIVRLRSWWSLLIESAESIAEAPRYVKLLIVARALTLAAFGGFLWAGFLGGVRLVLGLGFSTTALPYLSGVLLLIAVGVERYAIRLAPRLRFSLADAGDSLAAAAGLAPVVDLAQPLPETIARGTTLLHEALLALSSWKPRDWPDEAAYRAALEVHLQRRLPALRIERDRWVGRSRRDGVTDIVIDAVVVIAVLRGFDDTAARRALTRVKTYGRAWSGKPMILAIFDAPGDAVLRSAQLDALVELHDELALTIVRMPAY